MQATINVAPHLSRRIARLFNASAGRRPTILPALLICFLVGTSIGQTVSRPTNTATPSDAQKAFEKLKTLAGSWQGTVMGKSINITIRLTSSGSAILHEANAGSPPPEHEITMFYVEGDRLLATHYCDAGNRQRWEGTLSKDGASIEFNFLDVAGGTQRGFVKRTVFTTIDANKHLVELTFTMPDGKPIEARGEFERIK